MRITTEPIHVGCVGKRRFSTFEAASAVARRQNRGRGERIQPYHCRLCHGFHVGEGLGRKSDDRKRLTRAFGEP